VSTISEASDARSEISVRVLKPKGIVQRPPNFYSEAAKAPKNFRVYDVIGENSQSVSILVDEIYLVMILNSKGVLSLTSPFESLIINFN